MFSLRGELMCRACADARLAERPNEYGEGDVVRELDPTLCLECGSDAGSTEQPEVGGLPICPPCAATLRARPFPGWIKASFAGLLVLLVGAAVAGRPYFEAGRAVLLAERSLDAGDPAEAAQLLSGALELAPDSAQAMVLKVKADLLSGDFPSAFLWIERFGDRSGQSSEIEEINRILERVHPAIDKFTEAREVAGDRPRRARELLEEAIEIYPESQTLRLNLIAVQASIAFDDGDYEGFLASGLELVESQPEDSFAHAMVASAHAALYAQRGDDARRAEAEAALARAEELAQGDPELVAALDEYAERIRHRIETREIITKEEYDRRFRAGEDES